MVIHWYPGHMTKALRMMEKEIKLVDVIIYVLDARAPFSCLNPSFTKLVGEKPIVYVLNKSDMADQATTKEWQNYFSKKGEMCIVLDSTATGSAKKIEIGLKTILAERIERMLNKNVTMNIRAMILGVPNSGKSTLINNLSGKAKTVTGNKPGVTRGKQWIKINSQIEVLDTPGTLWPAFNNNLVAKHLAYIGSIREEVLDIPTLSIEFIKDFRARDKTVLENRFKIEIEEGETDLEVLEKVCRSRGFLVRGGELDYDRGAFAVINDFKNGRYGNITLEKVSDINKLLVNDRHNKEEEKKNNKK